MVNTAEIKKRETLSPLIVDLGKRKKKDIKQLLNGTGTLIDEIRDCIGELIVAGSCSADAQPIVVIVRPKRKTGRMLLPGY